MEKSEDIIPGSQSTQHNEISPNLCLADEISTNDSVSTTDTKIEEDVLKAPKQRMHSHIFVMIKRVEDEPPIQYIWSGIKKGTFGYVYGPAKSGKTVVCENLGMSIAAKRSSFMGMPIDSSGIDHVLFVSMEEYWKNRSERNQKQISALPDVSTENFSYSVVNETFPISMDSKKSWKALETTIVESKADLVFIDSFTRLTWDEVEKSKIGSEISRNLKDLTNRLNITMVVVHHSSKMTDSSLELGNMAGSRVVGQEADFILGVNKLTNGTRYFKEVATRYKQEDELVTTFSIEDDLWIKKISKIKEELLFIRTDHRENTENVELVYDTIIDLKNPENEVKPGDVVKQLEAQIGKSRIYEIFKTLESTGKIDRSKKGMIKLVETTSKE